MKKFMFLTALACMLVAGTTKSALSSNSVLSVYRVLDVEDSVMRKIAVQFEVIKKLKNGYEVLVPFDQTDKLLELDPNSQLIEEDTSYSLRNLNFSKSSRQYLLFPQIIEKIEKLEQENPNLVQIVQYGKSAEGKPLFAVKISDNVTVDEDEPELMITAATHGNEIITTEVVLGLMDKLIAGYGKDSRLTKMAADHELYFIPVVNADGFVDRERYDNGRDPNRSYPYPENPTAKSTASISALIEFFKSRSIEASLDFHAYGELTMYPWAYTYESVPQKDRQMFDDLTKKMAATNNYTYGPISKVIYVAKGSSADYYYWTKNTIALAIEIGNEFAPDPSEIEHLTNEQTESTWLFIESI